MAHTGNRIFGRFMNGFHFPHLMTFKVRGTGRDDSRAPKPGFGVTRLASVRCVVGKASVKVIDEYYALDQKVDHMVTTATDVSSLVEGDRGEFVDPDTGNTRYLDVVGVKNFAQASTLYGVACLEHKSRSR